MIVFNDFKITNDIFPIRIIFPAIILMFYIYVIKKITQLALRISDLMKMRIYFLVIFFVLSILLINLVSALKFPVIHFDSWQVFDTSRYTFSDFGKMNMIRQQIYNSQYQIAFPPLFPILVALLNYFFDFGIFATIILNYCFVLLIFYFVLKFGIQTKSYLVSILIGSGIVLNPEMLGCINGGSTIPLNILIFIITAYILIVNRDRYTIRHFIHLSFLSGMGVLNRFDYIPIALSLGFFIPFLTNKYSYLYLYFIILFLIVSPWIIYSQLHFEMLFVTDNGRRLINIPDTRPSTFFTVSNPPLTLFDNPKLWLDASIIRWSKSALSLNYFISQYTYLKKSLIAYCFLVIYEVSKTKERFNFKILVEKIVEERVVYLIVILSLLQTSMIIITGYEDLRYHILFAFLIYYILLFLVQRSIVKLPSIFRKKISVTILLIMSLVTLKPGVFLFRKNIEQAKKIVNVSGSTICYLNLCDNLEVSKYLENFSNSRIVINRFDSTMDIGKFSALSKYTTILSPTNINEAIVEEFVEFFEIDFLYSSDGNLVELFRSSLNVKPTGIMHLYALEVLND